MPPTPSERLQQQRAAVGNAHREPRHKDAGAAVLSGRSTPMVPATVLALQRAVGNANANRVLADRQQTTVQRAGRQVDSTIRELESRFKVLQRGRPQDAEQLGRDFTKFAHVLREFDGWMRGNDVGFRFGGSLSAFLHGGGKHPHDIDVEVSNQANMERLHNAITKEGSGWDWKTTSRDNKTAGIVARHENAKEYKFDIVSETHPGLDMPYTPPESMETEGEAVTSGGRVSREELIVNYLDRIGKKPEVAAEKGDTNQIFDLLRDIGITTKEKALQYWREHLSPIIENPRLQPMYEEFVSVINGGGPMDTSS